MSVATLQYRIQELESENGQIREHVKQQSRQIQILEQEQQGKEVYVTVYYTVVRQIRQSDHVRES